MNIILGILYFVGFILCLSYGIYMLEAMDKQLNNYDKYWEYEIPTISLVAIAGYLVFPGMNLLVGVVCWVFYSKEIREINSAH